MTQELETIYKELYPNSQIVNSVGNPLRYIDIGPQDNCIDLGCGGGENCYRMADMTQGIVAGVDIQPKMIEYAKDMNNNGIRFIQGDFLKTGFPDASFDRVISNIAFYHTKDKAAVIEEAYRLLRKGGKLCFCDFTIKKSLLAEFQDVIESSEWIEILKASSFYKTGGIYFIAEQAVYRQGRYEHINYSTFLAQK